VVAGRRAEAHFVAGARSVDRSRRNPTEHSTMGDVPPSQTVYIQNLNEKTKKDGAWGLAA